MSEAVMASELNTEKPKRAASLKVRLAKMSLTRDMWEGTHEIPEANHDFVLSRMFSDSLHIFKNVTEAVAAVKEAFAYEESRTLREKQDKAKEMMQDPEMAEILEGMVATGTGKVGKAMNTKAAAK